MRVQAAKASLLKSLRRVPVRVYGVAAALLGVLLGSYFLFVRPKNAAMAGVRDQIQSRRTSLQLFDVEMTKVANARRRVRQLDKAIASFENDLPRQGEIDVILREVWVIADSAGLKTQRIKTQKLRDENAYQVLPIEMSLQGRFGGVYSFLLKLERLPGIMNVESLRIVTMPGGDPGAVEASLVLNVFCKP